MDQSNQNPNINPETEVNPAALEDSSPAPEPGPTTAEAVSDIPEVVTPVAVNPLLVWIERYWKLALLAILLLAGLLRMRGLNWDESQHLHPDERFLTMVESAIKLPDSW